MNKKNIIRLTESDLHNIISESVKRILKEGGIGRRDIEIHPFEIFDPENGDIDYANSLLNDSNDDIRNAAEYMLKLINNDTEGQMGVFQVLIDTDGYDGYDWVDPEVDVVDYPDELDSMPNEMKQTILDLVKDYIENNKYYWDASDSDWIWDDGQDY